MKNGTIEALAILNTEENTIDPRLDGINSVLSGFIDGNVEKDAKDARFNATMLSSVLGMINMHTMKYHT